MPERFFYLDLILKGCDMNLSVFEKIRLRAEKYSDMVCIVKSTTLTIEAKAGGFPVSLEVVDEGFKVYFSGWHELFKTEDEALECFSFGLSEECRLAVEYRGTSEVKWTLQTLENGSWISNSTSGLIFLAFWRKKSTGYLQNAWIKAGS
jgi:hypothetical protein